MLATGPTPKEDVLIGKHFEYLKELTAKGTVLMAGRTLTTDAGSFGIVIYLAEDENTARSIFSEDPAVKAGVFAGDFYPFSVALLSSDWQKKKA